MASGGGDGVRPAGQWGVRPGRGPERCRSRPPAPQCAGLAIRREVKQSAASLAAAYLVGVQGKGSKWSQGQGARDTIVLFAHSTKILHVAPLACLRDRSQSLGHFPPDPHWLGGPEWIQATTSCAACTPVVVEPRGKPAHRMHSHSVALCVAEGCPDLAESVESHAAPRACLSPRTQLGINVEFLRPVWLV